MDEPSRPVDPRIDRRIWRVVGDPLLPSGDHKDDHPGVPTGDHEPAGELAGLRVAVKDLFAVAGFAIGAGNPTFLAQQSPQPEHAVAVPRLLDAGAAITGIAQTDEFAYSLAGTNIHYGTPPNPRAPGRISGGSSSGSASATTAGQVDIGLGTDTGGSIRVPASYQGLWGLRTTHGSVDRTGLLPLAPSFDTVGVLTRDPTTLRKAIGVLLVNSQRIASNYFDLAMIMDYWGPQRLNHHTEATTMLYGARECARLAVAEGIEARIRRHVLHGAAMVHGLHGLGLETYGDPQHRMANVVGVVIPDGIDGEQVRAALLSDFGIEIGTSFGPLHGRIWRIGTMGYNARRDAVLTTLAALEQVLRALGAPLTGGGYAAACEYYQGVEEA
jgi:hypothetical protein